MPASGQALSAAETNAVLDMLCACGARLASDWFGRPDIRSSVGADTEHHSPHHASVEWSAFGIAESRAIIDAQLILDAAGRSVRLWPENEG